MDTNKISLTDYCNEPAFPEHVSHSAFVYKDGSTDTSTVHSDNKGLTRLEFFTAMCSNKPDPVQAAKAILLELWQIHGANFAYNPNLKS